MPLDCWIDLRCDLGGNRFVWSDPDPERVLDGGLLNPRRSDSQFLPASPNCRFDSNWNVTAESLHRINHDLFDSVAILFSSLFGDLDDHLVVDETDHHVARQVEIPKRQLGTIGRES